MAPSLSYFFDFPVLSSDPLVSYGPVSSERTEVPKSDGWERSRRYCEAWRRNQSFSVIPSFVRAAYNSSFAEGSISKTILPDSPRAM